MAESIEAFEQQYSLVTAEVVTEINKLAKVSGSETFFFFNQLINYVLRFNSQLIIFLL